MAVAAFGAGAGVGAAAVFVTSAFSSYSGCRQYRENIAAACESLGEAAPVVDKIRVFFNHPGFVYPMARNLLAALERFPETVPRSDVAVLFTAHSIPLSMAETSRYVTQLKEASRLVAERAGARRRVNGAGEDVVAEVPAWGLG